MEQFNILENVLWDLAGNTDPALTSPSVAQHREWKQGKTVLSKADLIYRWPILQLNIKKKNTFIGQIKTLWTLNLIATTYNHFDILVCFQLYGSS